MANVLLIFLLVKVRHFFKEIISNSFHRCDGHVGPPVSVRQTITVSNQKWKEFRINVILVGHLFKQDSLWSSLIFTLGAGISCRPSPETPSCGWFLVGSGAEMLRQLALPGRRKRPRVPSTVSGISGIFPLTSLDSPEVLGRGRSKGHPLPLCRPVRVRGGVFWVRLSFASKRNHW